MVPLQMELGGKDACIRLQVGRWARRHNCRAVSPRAAAGPSHVQLQGRLTCSCRAASRAAVERAPCRRPCIADSSLCCLLGVVTLWMVACPVFLTPASNVWLPVGGCPSAHSRSVLLSNLLVMLLLSSCCGPCCGCHQ